MAKVPDSEAFTAVIAIGNAFAQECMRRLASEKPEAAEKLAQLMARDGVKFDLCIRDLNGFAPCVELVAVVGEDTQVIGSTVLKRREEKPQ